MVPLAISLYWSGSTFFFEGVDHLSGKEFSLLPEFSSDP